MSTRQHRISYLPVGLALLGLFGIGRLDAAQLKYLSLNTNAGLTLFGDAGASSGGQGKFGEGLKLDGDGDYAFASGGYGGTPLGTGARTVSIWFKRSVVGPAAAPVGLGFNGTGTKFDIELDNGTNEMETAVGNGRTVDAATGGWVADQWYLAVAAAPAGATVPGIKTYLDAVIRANTSGSATAVNTDDPASTFNPAPGSTNLTFGTSSNTVTSGSLQFAFNGIVDDLAIWDEELTQDEISALLFVGNSLGYAADSFDQLKTVHDNAGGSATINGLMWVYAANGVSGNSLSTVVLDSAIGSGVVAVPEPAMLWLLGFAFTFVFGLFRRKR